MKISYDREAGIEILDAVRRLGDPAVLRQVILDGVGPTASSHE
jgi:hypothetical protein